MHYINFRPERFVTDFFYDLNKYADQLERRGGPGKVLLLDKRDRRQLAERVSSGVDVDWFHFRGITILWSERPV